MTESELETSEFHFEIPFDAEEGSLNDAQALRQMALERVRVAAGAAHVGASLCCTDLLQDAEQMLCAVEKLEAGETFTMGESAGFLTSKEDLMYRQARTLRAGIESYIEGDCWFYPEPLLAIAKHLERTLKGLEEKTSRENMAAWRARDEGQVMKEEQREVCDIDPLSPAGLEKTIGIDGLRRLHTIFDELSHDDGAINQLERYVEQRDGLHFHGEEAEPGYFESDREMREKLDPTKPLGYYDADGNPRQAKAERERAELPADSDEDGPDHWATLTNEVREIFVKKLNTSGEFVQVFDEALLEYAERMAKARA